MAGMSEAQARRVLDDPKSTPEQRRQAEIVLGMPPADGGLGNVVGPAGVPPGEGAGPPGPPPDEDPLHAAARASIEQAKLRQRHLTEKERLAALEAMDLSKYEK